MSHISFCFTSAGEALFPFQRGQMFFCGVQFFVFSGETSMRLHRAPSFFVLNLMPL